MRALKTRCESADERNPSCTAENLAPRKSIRRVPLGLALGCAWSTDLLVRRPVALPGRPGQGRPQGADSVGWARPRPYLARLLAWIRQPGGKSRGAGRARAPQTASGRGFAGPSHLISALLLRRDGQLPCGHGLTFESVRLHGDAGQEQVKNGFRYGLARLLAFR